MMSQVKFFGLIGGLMSKINKPPYGGLFKI